MTIQFLFNLFYSTRILSFQNDYLYAALEFFDKINYILIIDIIFNSFRTTKSFYFFLYYLSPMFYLEALQSESSADCLQTTFLDNDQLVQIISFTFKKTIPVCSYDDYIYIMIGIILFIVLLFGLVTFIPVKYKPFSILEKCINFLLYLLLKTFVVIFFTIFTKKLLYIFPPLSQGLKYTEIIWIVLFLMYFLIGIVYYSFTENEKSIMNYLYQSTIINIFLKIFSGILISLRSIPTPTLFVKVLWIIFFLKETYFLFKQYQLDITVSKTNLVKYYMNILFVSFCIVRLLSTLIIAIAGKSTIVYHTPHFKGLEIALIVILYAFLIKLLSILKYNQHSFKALFNCLNNNNEKDTFQYYYIHFIRRLTKYFEFCIQRDSKLNDKESNIELHKMKSEIVKLFKGQLNNNLLLPIEASQAKEEDSFLSSIEQYDSDLMKICQDKKQLDTSHINLTAHETQFEEEFKTFITTVLAFIKTTRKYIKQKFWNSSQKKKITELLLISKIICFYELDEDNPTRSEYFVKKYLNTKKYSSKFYIILLFLDLKFKNIALQKEDLSIQSIFLFQIGELYLKIIAIYQQLLENFELNGETNQKRLELLEKENTGFGLFYYDLSYFELNNSKCKLKDQSGFIRFKLANTLLFNDSHFDKYIEDQDIQLADIDFSKNNFFFLKFKTNLISIKKSPYDYLSATGFKGKELLDEDYQVLFPKCFRKDELNYLKDKIMREGHLKFEHNTFVLTKEGFVMKIALNFNILPIISDDIMILVEVNLRSKDKENCIIVNSNDEIIGCGKILLNFFGIKPQMLPLTCEDIFDTDQPIQNKCMKRRVNPGNSFIQNEKKIIINIKHYLKAHTHIVVIKGSNFKDQTFIDNIRRYIGKGGDDENVNHLTILFLTIPLKIKHSSGVFNAFSVNLPFNANSSSLIINKNEYETRFEIDKMHLPAADFNATYSTSSMSMSSSSATSKGGTFAGTKVNPKTAKKASNLPEILEITVGILLIIIVIVLAIVIQQLSSSTVNVFSVLKEIRTLNSVYYRSIFHLLNIAIYDDYMLFDQYSNEIEMSLGQNIKVNYLLNDDFINTANLFFSQYDKVLKNIYLYIDSSYIENELNIKVTTIQTDGQYKESSFLTALNEPKLLFYSLSQLSDYYQHIKGIDMTKPLGDQFNKLTETERNLYMGIINYQNIVDKFIIMSNSISSYFESQFGSYKMKIYLIFSMSIIINILSFGFYISHAIIANRKIMFISQTFFGLSKGDILFLQKKLLNIKKIIDVEEKVSVVYGQIINDTKDKKTEQKNKNAKNKHQGIENGVYFNVKNEKTSLKTFFNVVLAIVFISLTYVAYAVIVFPILIVMLNNIQVIQNFASDLTTIQQISVNYFLTTQEKIFINQTDQEGFAEYIDSYPALFYQTLRSTKNLMLKSSDLTSISSFMDSLLGDSLCDNLYKELTSMPNYEQLHQVCNEITILKSSWTNTLSHCIKVSRIIFYNFVNTEKKKKDIQKYYHHHDFQVANLIFFVFVQPFIEDIKDEKGYRIYQDAINSFVTSAIVMFVMLILLEIVDFIIIISKIVKKIKSILGNFILMEKFFNFK